ncbi:MAG: hypothetical protein KA763_12600, partial [Xanthomonadales bacterium]|nr:hypothetical protein [Xanthomonadales bacterium]
MGGRWTVRLLLALALIATTCWAVAAPNSARVEAGLPFLRNYSPRDYAAHAQNWTVVQDHRG